MAPTPAPKNTVHWAPSPVLSTLSDSCSSASTSSISSTSTLQYINGQLFSHGFAVSPGLCLDGLSSADAEGVTKCLLSMLGQRVEDMTRAEDLMTKLRTLSYDYERLRTMHGAATETAENAEREAAAARAKLTIAKRAQDQAEAMHKQTTGDLQRARTALQALRATHVAEIKRREKEIEGIRERWSKLSDAQLKIGMMPSGMSVSSSCLQPANASALVRWSDGAAAAAGDAAAQKGRAIHDVALEEAEKACVGLRERNGELKALVVDAANAVRNILHKALSSTPDDLEFPPPLATIDLFPLGAPDAAFEKLSALVTSLRDALATLRTCDALPAAGTASTSRSNPKPQISPADLAKKAAESDAKAHKWEVEELRATIVSLRDELRKIKGERKPAPASRMQDVLVAQDKLASYLPPNDESDVGPALEPQHDQVTNSEPDRVGQNSARQRDLLVSTKPEIQRAAAPPLAAPQPGSSRLSPRKTRSKSKSKPTFKSPLKPTRRASTSAKQTASGSRPRRLTSGLTGKRVEASFETEVKPSTVPAVSLLPTSFVLPPPPPESRPLPHIGTLFTPSVPLQLIPSSTTPPFSPLAQPPPPASSSNSTTAPPEGGETRAVTSEEIVPSVAQPLSSVPQPPTSKPFLAAKPQARKISHAYSPAKPSPLSRILTLADFPESMPAAAPTPAPQFNSDPLYPPGAFTSSAVPVFEQPPIPPPIVVPTLSPVPILVPVTSTNNTNSAPAPAPGPVPLRTGSTSNAAGAGASSQRRRKRTSREAELDLDADADADASKAKSKPKPKSKSNANTKANDARSNSKSAAADAEVDIGMDVDSSDAAPTRDPRAPEKENTIRRRLKGGPAAVAKTRGGGVKTRKMAANAAKSGAPKSSAPAPAPGPAPVVMNELPPATEGARVGGAAGRLLAAVHEGSGGTGPRRIPIDSTVVGVPARRVS